VPTTIAVASIGPIDRRSAAAGGVETAGTRVND
jgi:hypothetical protein